MEINQAAIAAANLAISAANVSDTRATRNSGPATIECHPLSRERQAKNAAVAAAIETSRLAKINNHFANEMKHPAPAPVSAEYADAKRFLDNHYQGDTLETDRIRLDLEHWEWVAGDAKQFPNADLVYIDQFSEAAYAYLAGPDA